MTPEEMAAQMAEEVAALPEQTTKPMRAVRKAFSKSMASESADFVYRFSAAWLSAAQHQWMAYELIAGHTEAYQALDRHKLATLGSGMNNWWTVDAFGRTLSGPAWRDGLIDVGPIRDWARSEDFWWRRAALVSTVALNLRSQGGCGDTANTLAICEMLADDHEDMVVKALSWALRHLIPHDPAAVTDFLARHEESLHARVKREVRNKLRTGLKNPKKA